MLRTLRGRLALTYACLIVAIIALLGGALVFSIHRLYVDRLSDQLETQARIVASAAQPAVASGHPDEVDAVVKALGEDIEPRLSVVGPDGTVLGDSDAEPKTLP